MSDPIDSMPVGSALDEIVSRQVLRIQICPSWRLTREDLVSRLTSQDFQKGPCDHGPNGCIAREMLPPYSGDATTANRMLLQAAADGRVWNAMIEMGVTADRRGLHYAARVDGYSSEGDSYPLAICRAALKATADSE